MIVENIKKKIKKLGGKKETTTLALKRPRGIKYPGENEINVIKMTFSMLKIIF